MSAYDKLIYVVLVGFLWGATNPFIKNTTNDIETIETKYKLFKYLLQLKRLLLNVPFIVNQLGSVLFFITLQSEELSFVVPITNSLTFVFTGIVSIVLGEETPDLRTASGIVLVLCGITLCAWDKLHLQEV